MNAAEGSQVHVGVREDGSIHVFNDYENWIDVDPKELFESEEQHREALTLALKTIAHLTKQKHQAATS